jgi:hypothetical protein
MTWKGDREFVGIDSERQKVGSGLTGTFEGDFAKFGKTSCRAKQFCPHPVEASDANVSTKRLPNEV